MLHDDDDPTIDNILVYVVTYSGVTCVPSVPAPPPGQPPVSVVAAPCGLVLVADADSGKALLSIEGA